MSWLRRNAEPLEAVAALITAGVAVAALVAIPLQIRATAALQAEQSARDIYREFVALSINKPNLASPDYCEISSNQTTASAYSYYIEYMLYTAEQVTSLSPEWLPVMQEHMDRHQSFFCANPEWLGDTPTVRALIAAQRVECAAAVVCDNP